MEKGTMKELKTHRDVVLAILDGYEVEIKDEIGEGWSTLNCKSLWIYQIDQIDSYIDKYRIKPTKPSIDWSHVHPKYKYLARDKNGNVYLYDKEPYMLTTQWGSNIGVIHTANTHSSLKVGNCDWTESLVERPEGV